MYAELRPHARSGPAVGQRGPWLHARAGQARSRLARHGQGAGLLFVLLRVLGPAQAWGGESGDVVERAGKEGAARRISISADFERVSSAGMRQFRLTSGSSPSLGPLWLQQVRTNDLRVARDDIVVRVGYPVYHGRDSALESIRISAIVGMADLDLKGRASRTNAPDQAFEVRSRRGIAYGLGARTRFFPARRFSFYADAEMIWSRHENAGIDPVGNLGLEPAAGEEAAQEFEASSMAWHVSFRASYPLKWKRWSVAPHCGARLHGMDVDVEGRADFFSAGALTRSQSLAYSATQGPAIAGLIGVEAALGRGPAVRTELSVADGFGLSGGISWRF